MYCRILNKATGVPLVFLHGFLGTSNDWRHVVSYLPHRTCLCYDLPGHGMTPWTEMQIEELIASALPPEPVDLVGYSLGGRLAVRFAQTYPSRVRNLTLVSSHYGLPTEEERTRRLQQDRVWAQKILVLPFDDFLSDWYTQPVFSSLLENSELRTEIVAKRRGQRPKDLARALVEWSLGRQPCYKDLLEQYSRPLQIFYGERDDKFASLYKGWDKAKGIRDAGHCLHLETPQTIAELL